MDLDLAGLDDSELAQLIADARALQHERALAEGDLDATVADGFAQGFANSGKATDPWISGRIIVCPGSLSGPSRNSHDCSFVKVADAWVWQAGEVLVDEVRPMSDGGRFQQRSVTLLAASDGLELDLVSCRYRSGSHRLVGARSFVVSGGLLELTRTRTVQVDSHGR